MRDINEIWSKMDEWSTSSTPFIFFLDYELEKPRLYRLDQIPHFVHLDLPSFKTTDILSPPKNLEYFEKFPLSFQSYEAAFQKTLKEINLGNSYLLNLSFPSPINTNLSLSDIYQKSNAKYKVLIEDEFVCFSPESFIQIKDHQITTFPMKGTIDAAIPNAESILKTDKKEMAEHATIVDLLRNDLSQVARKVKVEDFAYLEKITTHGKDLFQMSSKISGTLIDPSLKIGTILSKLLPAGSISGAPKNKTCEIIQEVENHKRSYYTGISGIFDGSTLDSFVMIRFIEKIKNQLHFRSGGGLTFQSEASSEYAELLDKIYVPIHRDHSNSKGGNSSFSLSQSETK